VSVWMMYTLVLKLLCFLALTGSTKIVQLPGCKNITPALSAEKVSKATKVQQIPKADYLISLKVVPVQRPIDKEKGLGVAIQTTQLYLPVD